MTDIYKKKYLKYKLKYLNLLKNIKGGVNNEEEEWDEESKLNTKRKREFGDLELKFRIEQQNLNTLISQMYEGRLKKYNDIFIQDYRGRYLYQYYNMLANKEVNQLFTNIESCKGNTIRDGLSILLGMNTSRTDNALQPSYADILIYDFFLPYLHLEILYNTVLRWEEYISIIKNTIKVDDLRVIKNEGNWMTD
jgi:hypothetical protein